MLKAPGPLCLPCPALATNCEGTRCNRLTHTRGNEICGLHRKMVNRNGTIARSLISLKNERCTSVRAFLVECLGKHHAMRKICFSCSFQNFIQDSRADKILSLGFFSVRVRNYKFILRTSRTSGSSGVVGCGGNVFVIFFPFRNFSFLK